MRGAIGRLVRMKQRAVLVSVVLAGCGAKSIDPTDAVDGGPPESAGALLLAEDAPTFIALSADESTIVWQTRRDATMTAYDRAHGTTMTFAAAPLDRSFVRLSDDGGAMVFRGAGEKLFLARPHDGTSRLLADQPSGRCAFAISPDGRTAVYWAAEAGGTMALHDLDLETETDRIVGHAPAAVVQGSAHGERWSSDGALLLVPPSFVYDRRTSSLIELPASTDQARFRGETVVGIQEEGAGQRAWRWTAATGVVALPVAGSTVTLSNTGAYAVTSDVPRTVLRELTTGTERELCAERCDVTFSANDAVVFATSDHQALFAWPATGEVRPLLVARGAADLRADGRYAVVTSPASSGTRIVPLAPGAPLRAESVSLKASRVTWHADFEVVLSEEGLPGQYRYGLADGAGASVAGQETSLSPDGQTALVTNNLLPGAGVFFLSRDLAAQAPRVFEREGRAVTVFATGSTHAVVGSRSETSADLWLVPLR